jgi:hypothetical protein
LRRRHEPGALGIADRLTLMRRLTDHGIPVVAACNPWNSDWVPDPEPYANAVADAGARGIWWECLHFTGAQADLLPVAFRDELLFRANVQPMYLIGQLKRWYAACESRGLDFYPTPKWDGYFGHKAKHPECADPAWFGGKTFAPNFDLLKRVSRRSEAEGGALVAFGWPDLEHTLLRSGIPNATLNTDPFWYPYNASVDADRAPWRATLGKRAPLYQILRYFWNHPYENQHLVWYHPLVQALYDGEANAYVPDPQTGEDLVAVYNPTIKHHGSFTLDVRSDTQRPVVSLVEED